MGLIYFFPLKGLERVDGFADDVGRSDSWAYCTAPELPSQVQRKGRAGQQGPVALLALIQADTWGHVSCACKALRHQLACLSLPRSSTMREVLFRTPCCEPILAKHLLFPGFFIFCWTASGEGFSQLRSPLQCPSAALRGPALLILLLLT